MKAKLMKVSVLLVVLVLMLSMAACGGGDSEGGDSTSSSDKTALELYNAASKKLSEADSYSATSDMTAKTEAAGESMDTTVKTDIKQVKSDEDKVEMEVVAKSNIPGQGEVDVTAYYTDGFYYMNVAGRKQKMEMSLEDVMKQTKSGTMVLTEDMVKEQSVKDADGGQEATLVIDGQKALDMGMGALDGMEQYQAAAEDMKIGDMTVTAVIDESGSITSIGTKLNITMSISDQEMSIDMDMTMKITKVGGVTVELPKDLDTYQESAPSTLMPQ